MGFMGVELWKSNGLAANTTLVSDIRVSLGGIDFAESGRIANDAGDADTGANNYQNFPVFSAAFAGTSPVVMGSLSSEANTEYTIEFFSNPAGDIFANGQGETFLGRTMVTTNGSGIASFSPTLSTAITDGQIITATATDPSGNTSEFSVGIEADEIAPMLVSAIDRPNDAGGAINLTWTPSTSSAFTQQRIYRGTVSGGPYTLVTTIANSTTKSYTDTNNGAGLSNGTTYYYVIRGFDPIAPLETNNSDELSAAPSSNVTVNRTWDGGGGADTVGPMQRTGTTIHCQYRPT